MNESLITVRYVKALYDLAVESNLLKETERDVKTIIDIIDGSQEFKSFLESPIIKISEKNKMFDQLFGKELNQLTLTFLHLLAENKREMHLKHICLHYIRYNKQNQGIKEAMITTAIPLAKEHKEELRKFITKKFKINIDLTEKVDPEVIGGFVLRIEDQQINASILAQLNKIRRELIHT